MMATVQTESLPQLPQHGVSINAEMKNPSRWANESQDSLLFSTTVGCDTNNSWSTRFCGLVRDFFDSHKPLSWFCAVAFLGLWLPKKRYSIWPLTFVPLFLLLFGVGAHLYFMSTSPHRSIHIGSKMLLSTLWISAFGSYVFALYYLRYHSLEWLRDLNRLQHRACNIALVTGLFLVSCVLFGDAYYQIIFDLVNIKDNILGNCHRPLACNAVFYTLAVSVYWGMYSSVVACCVFFALCLVMTNDLTKGYRRLETCTGNVRNALALHEEVRQQIGERINGIKMWFLVHMIFYVVVILANIFEWLEAAHEFHFTYQYMAQICGTLVVAYKFFFPFLSASYVTLHESTLAQALNDKVDFLAEQTFYSRHDLEIFLQQSRRRGYGFRMFKVQVTLTIAIFSLLGSVFGLVHSLKD